MEERLYTIDEVCKIIQLIQEINNSRFINNITSYPFKYYLKILYKTFNKKVNVHDSSKIYQTLKSAKYVESKTSLCNKLYDYDTIDVLYYLHFDRWIEWNLKTLNVVTKDRRKVKIKEVIKDEKLAYPVIGTIEGETEIKYWSRTGELKIGETSKDDIYYIGKCQKDIVYKNPDVYGIL